MARPKLTLFLDVVSPFGYMAFYVTRNSPIFKSCDVKYIPIFLGGVMQACGNTPPIKVKNKDKYIGADRDRLAKLFNVPIVAEVPEPFPPNTLPVQRALCTIESQHPDKLVASFEALYQAFWIEGKPIGEPETVVGGLANVFGEERAKEILASTAKPEVKKHLNANTESALNAGAFGVPFFVATNRDGKDDVFFGFDRLGMIADFLGLDKGKGESGFKSLL